MQSLNIQLFGCLRQASHTFPIWCHIVPLSCLAYSALGFLKFTFPFVPDHQVPESEQMLWVGVENPNYTIGSTVNESQLLFIDRSAYIASPIISVNIVRAGRCFILRSNPDPDTAHQVTTEKMCDSLLGFICQSTNLLCSTVPSQGSSSSSGPFLTSSSQWSAPLHENGTQHRWV